MIRLRLTRVITRSLVAAIKSLKQEQQQAKMTEEIEEMMKQLRLAQSKITELEQALKATQDPLTQAENTHLTLDALADLAYSKGDKDKLLEYSVMRVIRLRMEKKYSRDVVASFAKQYLRANGGSYWNYLRMDYDHSKEGLILSDENMTHLNESLMCLEFPFDRMRGYPPDLSSKMIRQISWQTQEAILTYNITTVTVVKLFLSA